ncbi:hypothetical protein J7K27_02440 [Candidatus Bathyarchaeota archaeon]|nr:hypothetical protein [Candidatus Bathyarchaeota archaeon]
MVPRKRKTTSIRIRCTEETRRMFRKIAIDYPTYEDALLALIDSYVRLHSTKRL